MQFESSSIGENSKKQVQEINRLATVCQRKNCIKTNLMFQGTIQVSWY